MGKLYIDVHGKMEVTNLTKNIKAELNIQRQGWTTKNAYKVEGKVSDSDGLVRYEIKGKWNQYLNLKDLKTQQEEEVWKADPRHPTAERQYGFGHFAMNINYYTEDMKKYLPPTDSRIRLD